MIFPQIPRWILNSFVILMSTYYNKSNSRVKESSEHTLIEMSISNGVLTPSEMSWDITYMVSWPTRTKNLEWNLLDMHILLCDWCNIHSIFPECSKPPKNRIFEIYMNLCRRLAQIMYVRQDIVDKYLLTIRKFSHFRKNYCSVIYTFF